VGRPLRFASLFTGSGGFDLGLERAGHECVLQNELDDFRAALCRRHWPDVPLVRDVRDVRAGQPLHAGAVDLLTGGFPCRDLSVVGKRRGLEAAEAADGSGLFFELCRVADDLLRPGGWLLIENVPGMLTSNGGRDFAVLLRTLGDLGFHDLAWRVLDSRLHGVPQSRRRVFILARRAPGSAARRVLLDGPVGAGDSQAGREAGAGAPGAGSNGDRADSELSQLIDEGEVTRALTARLGTSGWDLTDAEGNLFVVETVLGRDYSHTLMAEGHDASEDGTGRGTPLILEDVMAIAENQRGEVLEVPDARTLVAGGGKPGLGYPLVRIGERVRRLTPTECERLQGFPDGWTLRTGPSLRRVPPWWALPPEERSRVPVNPRPHAPRYEAMGRAVTVPVAEAIGRRLLEEDW
jgi:DNA (cytosine-5)-methyltransferase 1